MWHAIHAASWANIWAAISAIFTALAVIVAGWAMLRWRKQEELKVKLAFKQAIANYSYRLMLLPTMLQQPNSSKHNPNLDKYKELIDCLSACHNAWLLAEGLMEKDSEIVDAWEFIFENHKEYLCGRISSLVLGAHCTTILEKKFVFN